MEQLQPDNTGNVMRKLGWVSLVCFIFMSAQVAGGFIANSIAIMSDAMHLLSDLLAFAVSAYSVWLSKQQAPLTMTYGYHKVQTLGALINIAIIWIVTVVLLIEATERIINKEVVKNPKFMLYTSIFGLFCNLVMVQVLHSDTDIKHDGCSHDHGHGDSGDAHGQAVGQQPQGYLPISDHAHQDDGHGHSHGGGSCGGHGHSHSHSSPGQIQPNIPYSPNTLRVAHEPDHEHSHAHKQNHPKQQIQRVERNLNIEAAYIHILGDIILSIGVMISAIIIYFTSQPNPTWNYYQLVDPFCTYLFSVLVIMTTFKITKKSIVVLLDGCVEEGLIEAICADLGRTPGLVRYEELRVWSVSGEQQLATLKVVLTHPSAKDTVRHVFSSRKIPVVIEPI